MVTTVIILTSSPVMLLFCSWARTGALSGGYQSRVSRVPLPLIPSPPYTYIKWRTLSTVVGAPRPRLRAEIHRLRAALSDPALSRGGLFRPSLGVRTRLLGRSPERREVCRPTNRNITRRKSHLCLLGYNKRVSFVPSAKSNVSPRTSVLGCTSRERQKNMLGVPLDETVKTSEIARRVDSVKLS